MTDEEYSNLATQVMGKEGWTKQSQRFYDEMFMRLDNNTTNAIPLRYTKIDRVTMQAVMSLIEQGWVLNAPFGIEGHYEGVVVERINVRKGLVKINGEWHNLADLLSVGYGVVPF